MLATTNIHFHLKSLIITMLSTKQTQIDFHHSLNMFSFMDFM